MIHKLGAYTTEVWTDFVVHVRWSCRDAKPLAARCQAMPQGFLQVWKDGKQVVNYTGPTVYNDQYRVFWKAGIYKGMWVNTNSHVSKRVVYHDEFRIGDSNSSYAEVAPRSSTRDTTPPASPTLSITALPAQE